jgi:hypothetical protein
MLGKDKSREVRLQIRAVLMSTWDPIGVNDIPEAADEYDSYIGGAYELLERGASEESIRAYLRNIEIDAMGMVNGSGQPLLPDANRNAAAAALNELARYFR